VGFKSLVAGLLARRTPDEPPAKPGETAYRAIEIVAGKNSCEAVRANCEHRVLLSDAPRLPLAQCTIPEQCRCRFAKHEDRREGEDRRIFGFDGTSTWQGHEDRRRTRGRRPDDV
jgi:hypothetical protein